MSNNLLKTIADQVPEAEVIEFPLDGFPKQVREIIDECVNTLGFIPEFLAGAMLVVTGVAIGNTYCIDVDGENKGIAALFLLGIAESSIGKSQPFNYAIKPLQTHNAAMVVRYQRLMDEYSKMIKNMAGKTKSTDEDTPPPVLNKLITGDITPEALIEVLENNPRGILSFNDEFAESIENINRYGAAGSKGTGVISLMDGAPFNGDRKGGKKVVHIPKPHLSMMGTIQPSVLSPLAGGGRANNGYLFRALFCWAKDLDRKKKVKGDKRKIDTMFATRWQIIINRLIELPMTINPATMAPIPTELSLSDEADDIMIEWYNRNVDIQNTEADSSIKSICGKLNIMVYRLALIMQMMYYATGEGGNTCIESRAMKFATELIEYFRLSAYRVQEHLKCKSPIENLPDKFKVIYEALPDSFKFGEGLTIAKAFYGDVKSDTSKKAFQRFCKNNALFNAGIGSKRGQYTKINRQVESAPAGKAKRTPKPEDFSNDQEYIDHCEKEGIAPAFTNNSKAA